MKIRRLLNALAVLLAIGAGALVTATASALIAPEPALAVCENDECEGGDDCEDNPGGNTICAFNGEECKSLGCPV